MAYYDRTRMGGDRSQFATTHWSLVLEARTCDEDHQRKVLDHLIRRYWKPVYCFLRRKGHDNDAAKDLTQGFFEEIVLGKCLVRQADPKKGRFRTYLLTALDNYVVSVHRAAMRRKRHPRQGLLSLDEGDDHVLLPQSEEMQPHELFTYIWASTLLDEVLAEVEEGCVRDKKRTHWQLFRARVLGPIMRGDEPPSFRELCARLHVQSELAASNMIVTVKRRFKVALSQRIKEQLGTEEDVDEEIRAMMTILAKGRPQ